MTNNLVSLRFVWIVKIDADESLVGWTVSTVKKQSRTFWPCGIGGWNLQSGQNLLTSQSRLWHCLESAVVSSCRLALLFSFLSYVPFRTSDTLRALWHKQEPVHPCFHKVAIGELVTTCICAGCYWCPEGHWGREVLLGGRAWHSPCHCPFAWKESEPRTECALLCG